MYSVLVIIDYTKQIVPTSQELALKFKLSRMNLSSPKCRDIWKFFLLVICVHLGRQSSAQVTSGLSGRTENVDEAIDLSNVGPSVVENEG